MWLDVNGDGISSANELFSLADIGMASINLRQAPEGTEASDQSVESLDLCFTDNTNLSACEINMEAERNGIMTYRDEQSDNIVLLSENGTDGKGTDSRLNYVVQADDLSRLAKLMNPNTPLTEEERSSLLAMAAKYNLHPEDPEFAKKIKALTHSAIRVKDSDVISDVLPQADSLR